MSFHPFPFPAHPELLPGNDAQCREFLLSMLPAYLRIEETFERGTAVHGRGHIIRTWIFASTMSHILLEQGYQHDRTAVLCAVAGHDVGRLGGGEDEWEEDSARLTVQAMRKAFGPHSMGKEYEQALERCIISRYGDTWEAMLVHGADSLDIGRILPFDLMRFPFLQGIDFPDAACLREKLAQEAHLLQQLTYPPCTLGALDDWCFAEAPDAFLDAMTAPYRLMEAERNISERALMESFESTIHEHRQKFGLILRYGL